MRLPLEPHLRSAGLSPIKAMAKRSFDLVIAIIMLPFILPISVILVGLAKIFNERGLFIQNRVGRYGETFKLYKVCSMKQVEGVTTTVTADNDPRITKFGRFIRKTKLDELPQIFNVITGDMSFVGPRPDVLDAYQDVKEEESGFLCVRPGITGIASVAFKDEEWLLSSVDDSEAYNRTVIFPKKVKLNNDYIAEQSFLLDIKIMIQTVIKVFK